MQVMRSKTHFDTYNPVRREDQNDNPEMSKGRLEHIEGKKGAKLDVPILHRRPLCHRLKHDERSMEHEVAWLRNKPGSDAGRRLTFCASEFVRRPDDNEP